MDEHSSSMATQTQTQTPESFNNPSKRKRSVSVERPNLSAPPQKAAKTHNSHLQINYLVRQYSDTLPLISVDDTLPSILQLVSDYHGALERHESLAGNLGARLLGPILIKRFERLFDGPPTVLKCHGKEGTTVTWLDVVEFARHKPEQFNLEKMHDNARVCQFYTKQSRVEISEEDYLLIASGMPQKLIPPQPIAEDEEKELGTLEILEKNMGAVIQLTDQVAARARQLNHRLKNRRNAIISRREAEAPSIPDILRPKSSASDSTGHDPASTTNGERPNSPSPTSGFVAVNSRAPAARESASHTNGSAAPSGVSRISNGKTYHGATASPATRAELLNYFSTPRERANEMADYDAPRTNPSSRTHVSHHKAKPKVTDNIDYAGILLNSASPVPIPNTPLSLQPYNKPSLADRFDDSGPYKAEMLSRMDSMQRGDRVLPPCDRCRRLHMDCLKNLTACLGCTKKHAKCSWKDVTDQELLDNPHPARAREEGGEPINGRDDYSPMVVDGSVQGVRDEELLGEDDVSDDGKDDSPTLDGTALTTKPGHGVEASSAKHTPDILENTRRPDTPVTMNGDLQAPDASVSRHSSVGPARSVAMTPPDVLPSRSSESVKQNGSHGFETVNDLHVLTSSREASHRGHQTPDASNRGDSENEANFSPYADRSASTNTNWPNHNGQSGPTASMARNLDEKKIEDRSDIAQSWQIGTAAL